MGTKSVRVSVGFYFLCSIDNKTDLCSRVVTLALVDTWSHHYSELLWSCMMGLHTDIVS